MRKGLSLLDVTVSTTTTPSPHRKLPRHHLPYPHRRRGFEYVNHFPGRRTCGTGVSPNFLSGVDSLTVVCFNDFLRLTRGSSSPKTLVLERLPVNRHIGPSGTLTGYPDSRCVTRRRESQTTMEGSDGESSPGEEWIRERRWRR